MVMMLQIAEDSTAFMFSCEEQKNTKLLVYYKLQGNSVETYAPSKWPETE